jgi:hypothetical protein
MQILSPRTMVMVCKWYHGNRTKTPRNAYAHVNVTPRHLRSRSVQFVIMRPTHQLLSSLIVASLTDDSDDLLSDGSGPSVHRQSLVRFRRPATGVSGAESLSSSEDEESLFSPVRGDLGRGELSADDESLRELRES